MPRKRSIDDWSIDELLKQFVVGQQFRHSRGVSLGKRFGVVPKGFSEYTPYLPGWDDMWPGGTPGFGRPRKGIGNFIDPMGNVQVTARDLKKPYFMIDGSRLPTLGDYARMNVDELTSTLKDKWHDLYSPHIPMSPSEIKNFEKWEVEAKKVRSRYYKWWSPKAFGKEFAASKLGFMEGPGGGFYVSQKVLQPSMI